jgi:hypothetical protein
MKFLGKAYCLLGRDSIFSFTELKVALAAQHEQLRQGLHFLKLQSL